MGVLLDLYKKMSDGSINDQERKCLHNLVINQHQKDDTPTGVYASKSCPCDFGICDECIIAAEASRMPI